MTETSQQITLPAELESLALFRDHIKKACRGIAGLDEEAIYDVLLAVDEICTNIITHGYAGMDPGSIILNVEVTPETLAVTLSDFGHAFEPVEPPPPKPMRPWKNVKRAGLGCSLSSVPWMTFNMKARPLATPPA